ncbi:MAG: diacylglycerol/lipid kinase family protein [Thermoguttaceae bacterium]
MKYLFVIKNNIWEGATTASTLKKVETFCNQHTNNFTIVHTYVFGEEEGVVRRFLKENSERPVRIIVCGNLETLHFVINGFFGTPGVEVGFFPCDGDYDFYSAFPDVSPTSLSSIGAIANGNVLDIDLLKINDRYCINVANIGIDTIVTRIRYKLVSVAKRIPFVTIRKKILVTLTKYLAFFLDAPSTKITMRINGYETIHDSYSLVIFANTKKNGAGYICAPQAVSDDGLIDVIHSKRMSILMMPRTADILRKGNILADDYLRNYINYRRCCKVTVDMQSPVYISMDSTAYFCDKHFDISIIPAAIRILVPCANDSQSQNDDTKISKRS